MVEPTVSFLRFARRGWCRMRKWNFKSQSCFVLAFFLSASAFAESRLSDADKIRAFFGVSPRYDQIVGLENVKVAVLDNSFEGFDAHKDTLPDSTTLVEKYDSDFITRHHLGDPKQVIGFTTGDHGRRMAQIVWGVSGNKPHGPHLYLLNSNGITNFRRAVAYAIEQKVDIILYSQNWECCGNFDGGGFINQIVKQATDAGIIFVVAGGDYGGMVYNGPVRLGPDHKQVFDTKDGQQDGLRFQSHLDENPFKITLTWNAFTDDETAGTNKDLDLLVYDENEKLVAQGGLKQVLKKDKLADGETFLAREKVTFEAHDSGDKYYHVRVVARVANSAGLARISCA